MGCACKSPSRSSSRLPLEHDVRVADLLPEPGPARPDARHRHRPCRFGAADLHRAAPVPVLWNSPRSSWRSSSPNKVGKHHRCRRAPSCPAAVLVPVAAGPGFIAGVRRDRVRSPVRVGREPPLARRLHRRGDRLDPVDLELASPDQRERLLSMLNQSNDTTGAQFQVTISQIAVGSGTLRQGTDQLGRQ